MYRRYIAFVCRCFFNVKDYEVPVTAFLCVCTMILKGQCFYIGVLCVCLIEIQSEHLKPNVNLHDSLGALSTEVLHTYEGRDFVRVCMLLFIACFIFFKYFFMCLTVSFLCVKSQFCCWGWNVFWMIKSVDVVGHKGCRKCWNVYNVICVIKTEVHCVQ